MKQDQFLNVLDRDEAERRFRSALDLGPLNAAEIALDTALGRVLARDVTAPVDVPSFDRSNVDGFAVRAEDTFEATEERPRCLQLSGEVLTPGKVPLKALSTDISSAIATGAMIPRGADAVVMIEHTDVRGLEVLVRRPVAPGANITFAGTDIGRGETVLRSGDLLTSRETGVLAAIGVDRVFVVRCPRVAILSTGDELLRPGQTMAPGRVFDSNARILADSVRENGGEPVHLGIVPDDRAALLGALKRALEHDVVLLSGGTSKGEGDLCYRVIGELGPPGIIAHGVALKPGKPLCLAAVCRGQRTIPVAVLPGFPTSAIFTFHEFLAPVIRALAGRRQEPSATVEAQLPMRLNSERGRTEYSLVTLIEGEQSLPVAFPMGQGSGSVTTYSRADGFIIIPRQTEYLEAGSRVQVHLIGAGVRPADLVVIGSHCVGLDYLLTRLQEGGLSCKFLALGSTAGLEAARRGQCDLAGIHLLDPATNTYNAPFVTADLVLLPGYRRMQGVVFRRGDIRFEGRSATEAIAQAVKGSHCVMVNRNRGSGTRILIDGLLQGARPPGYSVEARSHNAVVAAVAQRRADWGMAIEAVRLPDLGFLPLREEHFDFVCPRARLERPGLQAFRQIIAGAETAKALADMGFRVASA